jgi:catechol 2,3-dioxygenase-like lactoylglutathione lyase family enzyme
VTVGEPVEALSAVTLVTGEMAASVAFYEALGFRRLYGGTDAAFTSFRVGAGFLNVQAVDGGRSGTGVWGRVIVHVDDVDAMHRRALAAGLEPEAEPVDAPWGERFFHLRDPDGHELSFARPL